MITGSTALKYHGITLGDPKDLDMLTFPGKERTPGIDYIEIPEVLYKKLHNSSGYLRPSDILTLKMSHLFTRRKFSKTKRHILELLKMGYTPDKNLYKELKNFWSSENPKDFLNLDKTKDEFFRDNVTYVIDHDELHRMVSFPDVPVYTKCLKDNKEVLIDFNKFQELSESDKLKMFREEITVIAIERWIINPYYKGKVSWFRAWNLALEKTITSLTKNWATDFIIFNLEMYSVPRFEYFKTALIKLGLIMIDREENKELLLGVLQDLGVDLNQEESYTGENLDNLVIGLALNDVGFNLNTDLYYTELEEIIKSKGYELIESEGGGEGGAEYCYSVFKLLGKIFRGEYSYYSHDGYHFEDIFQTLKEVKPVQKTITVYE